MPKYLCRLKYDDADLKGKTLMSDWHVFAKVHDHKNAPDQKAVNACLEDLIIVVHNARRKLELPDVSDATIEEQAYLETKSEY